MITIEVGTLNDKEYNVVIYVRDNSSQMLS